MADGLTTILTTYGPDIAKAMTAGVMGLSLYVWNQREKSIDALEADMKHERKNNENRIGLIYQKMELNSEKISIQVLTLERDLIEVRTRQKDCKNCP